MRFQLLALFSAAISLSIFPLITSAAKCPKEQGLNVQLEHRGDGSRLPAVYEKLKSCPHIRWLDLDMTSEGCVVTPEPWHFNFRKGDRLPPLKRLFLSNYDLEGKNTGLLPFEWNSRYWVKEKAVDFLRLTGLGPGIVKAWEETNLDKWLRAMDFSQIEVLHLAQDDSTFYDRMGHELPSLRSLYLEWSATPNTTAPANRIDFLTSIPPLHDLSVDVGAPYQYAEPEYNHSHYEEEHRMEFPLAGILARHCPQLASLTLHQAESVIASKRRPMLSVENITAIRHACPDLTSLTLDIDRDAETGWPLETLDALASFENLTRLIVHLEIGADLHRDDIGAGELDWNPDGLDRGGPFREPRMNLTAAEALFAYIRERKKGNMLGNVDFIVGDYGDKPYMGPLAFPDWSSGRARRFECQAPVEGEAPREGDLEFGWCRIGGKVGGRFWMDGFADDPIEPSPAEEMWGVADDDAVKEYLLRMERRE